MQSMDYENRGPQTPVEWFDLLGAECFGPGTSREQLLRLEVAHVADVIAALISKKAAADAVAALFALLLAALLLTALRATPRALFAARPTHPRRRTAQGNLCMSL